jgi:hypothetical protein
MAARLLPMLILTPIIRIETLRGAGAFRGGNQFKEVETFNRPFRLAHGPNASGAHTNAQRAWRGALGASEVFHATHRASQRGETLGYGEEDHLPLK